MFQRRAGGGAEWPETRVRGIASPEFTELGAPGLDSRCGLAGDDERSMQEEAHEEELGGGMGSSIGWSGSFIAAVGCSPCTQSKNGGCWGLNRGRRLWRGFGGVACRREGRGSVEVIEGATKLEVGVVMFKKFRGEVFIGS